MSMQKSASPQQATIGAAQAALTVNTTKSQWVGIHLLAGLVGTVSFEATIDGTNWVALGVKDSAGTAEATKVISTTAAILVYAEVQPYRAVRARCSAYTSGSAVCKAIKASTNGLNY